MLLKREKSPSLGLNKNSKRYFGDLGENFAKELLVSSGYKIVTSNFRSLFGEIDIIAVKDGVLVFVEVKTRWSNKFGAPEEAVDKRKLGKIKKAGEFFSLTHPTLPKKLRIDVVAIEVRKGKVTSAKIIPVY